MSTYLRDTSPFWMIEPNDINCSKYYMRGDKQWDKLKWSKRIISDFTDIGGAICCTLTTCFPWLICAWAGAGFWPPTSNVSPYRHCYWSLQLGIFFFLSAVRQPITHMISFKVSQNWLKSVWSDISGLEYFKRLFWICSFVFIFVGIHFNFKPIGSQRKTKRGFFLYNEFL